MEISTIYFWGASMQLSFWKGAANFVNCVQNMDFLEWEENSTL